MSAQNAIQLATAIQTKVGSSLVTAQSLLPPAEKASANLQAGAGSLGVFLLRDLYDMQQRTYECVEKVAHILQSQLDLAEEKERREKDQLAEQLKEKNFKGAVTGAGAGGDVNLDDIEDKLDANKMMTMLTAGLTAALASGTLLKTLGKSLGKKLIKGGVYGAIAGFIADPIINYVNENFDLELDADAKKELKLGLIGAGVGFGVAGIPGAIIGATVPMIAKVTGFIGGTLNADEVKDSDFAGAAIGSSAMAMFATVKAAGLLKGYAATASFGAALGAIPVVIGIGAAAALGVGVMYVAKKVDEYQEQILDKLAETVKDLDREMGEFAARQEEGLFERMGVNLGQLSALGEAKVAAQEASEQLGQNKEKFLADTQTQSTLKGLQSTMLKYSDDAISTILQDSTKANNFLDTVENLKNIAAKGGFGEDSQKVFESMAAFSDRVQGVAVKMVEQGIKGGKVQAVALNKEGIGGDQLENLDGKSEELAAKKEELRLKNKELEEAKLKLADLNAQGIESKFFGENEAEKTEDLIKKLEDEISGRNNPMNIENQIRMIEKNMNRFGTTNGLLYNLDELRELYKDDPGRLQAIIERSINQTGSNFIEAQKNSSTGAKNDGVVINNIDNSSKSQSNSAKQENYIAKLDTQGDPYFSREAYNYGAI